VEESWFCGAVSEALALFFSNARERLRFGADGALTAQLARGFIF
jgi:hypothetical protein